MEKDRPDPEDIRKLLWERDFRGLAILTLNGDFHPEEIGQDFVDGVELAFQEINARMQLPQRSVGAYRIAQEEYPNLSLYVFLNLPEKLDILKRAGYLTIKGWDSFDVLIRSIDSGDTRAKAALGNAFKNIYLKGRKQHKAYK